MILSTDQKRLLQKTYFIINEISKLDCLYRDRCDGIISNYIKLYGKN